MGYIGAITADGVAVPRGASTQELNDTYLHGSIEARRDSIEAVPGSGDILGVCEFNDVQYAWRNHTDGNSARMYKTTESGWERIDLGHKITFGSGASFPDAFDSSFSSDFSYSDELLVGDKLVGSISGSTCIVTFFQFLSGSLDDGDAIADVYFHDHEGEFIVGEQIRALRIATNGVGIITTANTDVEFPPNGHYEFDINNFGGHASTIKLYGCNGVGNAFEYDGETGVFIFTGMVDDAPEHIVVHKNHLFLMFSGGSVQNSSLGDPLTWSAITGANEIGVGDAGMGFKKVPGGQLAIFSRNKTFILSGTSNADWVLAEHSDQSGAIEWSIQRLSGPLYLDDRGLTTLQAVQDFGDFKDNVISDLIQPYLDSRTTIVTDSMVVKEKNQYRLFFEDGSAIYCTFKNNKLIGSTICVFGKKITSSWSGEDLDGKEVLYFGSTDGYVYKMDSGNSFDDETLPYSMRLPFYHYNTPTKNKRFFSVTLEIDLKEPFGTDLTLSPDFTYSDRDVPRASSIEVDSGIGGGIWGLSVWGEFAWGGALVGEGFVHLEGHGRNMGLLLTGSTKYENVHTVHGLTVDYEVLGRRT